MAATTAKAEEQLPPNQEGDDESSKSTMKKHEKRGGCSIIQRQWSKVTQFLHDLISQFVLILSLAAARNPKRTIALISFVSFALIGIGIATNFEVQVEYEKIYAPVNSLPRKHKNWIDNESGFPKTPRPFTVIIHNDGKNVLGKQQMSRVFQVLDTIRETTGYDDICSASTFLNAEREPECKILSATRFWQHSVDTFNSEIQTDEDAIEALSASTYSGGMPVLPELIMGYAEREEGQNNTLLASAKSYLINIGFPDVDGVDEFELDVLDRLLKIKEEWEEDSDIDLHLHFFTLQSYDTEFMRAINNDLVLVPVVGFVMAAFTCVVFFKRDRVQSRSLLGIGSVVTIIMSLMTGYGLMFTIGLPFTNMTQILPFVIFGIGLDDTFIITGAYFRTDPEKDVVERIRETMLEVGQSIALTTITTITAFVLGCVSSIPAIQWLCLYAFPTVFIDFVYQITFFIALLVLDERRVKANKKDICFCCSTKDETDEEEQTSQQLSSESKDLGFSSGFMRWYANQLLRPWVKVLVIALFTGYCAFCAYCTTNLTQEFKTQDFVPDGSYVAQFLESLDLYSENTLAMEVHFRNVDQSDPEIQQEMRNFVEDLMRIPTVGKESTLSCWVFDFQTIQDDPDYDFMKDLSFNDALALALQQPAIREAYGDNIARDEDGNITASRCILSPRNLDLDLVQDQIELLVKQREVSVEYSKAVNDGITKPLSFFTFDPLFFIWEFYAVAIEELVFTTISGVIAVGLVGFVLIRHWTVMFFVLPMILILYIALLGTLQFAGLHINVVTYVTLVISIGLLVDFLMHIMLRYYESIGDSREDKVKETLESIGASILVGGLSTFLGVIPLAFSTSLIIRTVFISFFAMVSLGLAHGLILLPVILSIMGPTVRIMPDDVIRSSLNGSVTERQNSERDSASSDCNSNTRESNIDGAVSSAEESLKVSVMQDHEEEEFFELSLRYCC